MNEKTPNKMYARELSKENHKMPHKYNAESLIIEILNEISRKRTQINFDSEEARRQIAKEIVDKYEQNSERQMKKSEIKAIEESKKEWICKHCGQSTFDVDYDYLCAQDEHLECALISENKSERKIAK
jgi:hypothetical protein